jgi:hypothetical protein
MTGEQIEDEWGGLSTVEGPPEITKPDYDPDEIIPEEELPFFRLKIRPDEEDEEEPSKIRTGTLILLVCW